MSDRTRYVTYSHSNPCLFRNVKGEIQMSDRTRRYVTYSHSNPLTFIFAILTACIGYHIHGSIFWAIIDWLFWPLAWIKWVICQEVSISIIKDTFAFFFQ